MQPDPSSQYERRLLICNDVEIEIIFKFHFHLEDGVLRSLILCKDKEIQIIQS